MNFEDVLWYIAVPTTVIFILQVIMTFMGMDGADGLDADFDGDIETEDGESGVFQLFTLRNLISFLLGLSWGGLIGYKEIHFSMILSTLFGVVAGIIFVILQTSLFKIMVKLEQKNIPNLDNAIGKVGKIYLPIIPNETGKVSVEVNGSFKVLDARSNSTYTLKTGLLVKVDSLQGDTLIVTPI